MSTRARSWMAMVLIGLIGVLSACAGGQSNGSDPAKSDPGKQQNTAKQIKENVLNVGIIWDPITFDPHSATSSESVMIYNMYEPLVYTKGASPEIQPWLAESWTVSPDGLKYTFKLRPDVKFHDGALLDAEGVKANFDRILRLKKGPFWVLEGLQEVKVVDTKTVEFSLKPGGPPFLKGLLLVRLVSPKALKEQAGSDDAQTWLRANAAGTGPYTLDRFERGDRVALKYFPDYWGGWKDGQFTHANLLILPEANTQALMIEKGDIDVAFKVPSSSLASFATKPDLSVVNASGNNMLTLRLNAAAGPTKDVKVRQALAYAFDYEGYIKAMAGTYEPMKSVVPPQYIGGFMPNFPYKLDVPKAKQLLEQAGYNTTNKAKVTIDILSGFQDQRSAAELLKAGAEQTGLAEVSIRNNEWAAMLRSLVEWGGSKDPATVRNAFGLWTSARIPDPYAYLWYLFHSKAQGGQGRNLIYYVSPAVDQAIDKGMLAATEADRLSAYKEAVQKVVDDSTDVVVGVQTNLYVIRKNLQNFYSDPNWYPSIQIYAVSRGK